MNADIEVVDHVSSWEFDSQIEHREEHRTRVETRRSTHNSEYLYCTLRGERRLIIGYIEFTRQSHRVTVLWIASWGYVHGVSGAGSMMLDHLMRLHHSATTSETRLLFERTAPAWLPAAQLNLFYSAGFSVKYWIWDDKNVVLCDMKRIK